MQLRSLWLSGLTVLVGVGMVSAVQAVTSRFTENNNLKLYGAASNPAGYFTIRDNALVTGKLNVKGNVSDSNGNLTLDDTVAITGHLIDEGDAEIKGEVYNSNGAVTVNDDLTVTGLFSINTMVTPTTTDCTEDGGMSYDNNYLYLCVASHWRKVPLESL
jgi:hypothetical protein